MTKECVGETRKKHIKQLESRRQYVINWWNAANCESMGRRPCVLEALSEAVVLWDWLGFWSSSRTSLCIYYVCSNTEGSGSGCPDGETMLSLWRWRGWSQVRGCLDETVSSIPWKMRLWLWIVSLCGLLAWVWIMFCWGRWIQLWLWLSGGFPRNK